jgi:hypothetical protein
MPFTVFSFKLKIFKNINLLSLQFDEFAKENGIRAAGFQECSLASGEERGFVKDDEPQGIFSALFYP